MSTEGHNRALSNPPQRWIGSKTFSLRCFIFQLQGVSSSSSRLPEILIKALYPTPSSTLDKSTSLFVLGRTFFATWCPDRTFPSLKKDPRTLCIHSHRWASMQKIPNIPEICKVSMTHPVIPLCAHFFCLALNRRPKRQRGELLSRKAQRPKNHPLILLPRICLFLGCLLRKDLREFLNDLTYLLTLQRNLNNPK